MFECLNYSNKLPWVWMFECLNVLVVLEGKPLKQCHSRNLSNDRSISGLVVEYIVAIDVTRVRFPADALLPLLICMYSHLIILAFTLAKSKFCWWTQNQSLLPTRPCIQTRINATTVLVGGARFARLATDFFKIRSAKLSSVLSLLHVWRERLPLWRQSFVCECKNNRCCQR